ncbi:ABC transporter substrate-binding protein [Natroniella sulfidigena]|uniref:ABC transporter substrate-binding protein n=1 Tax=Natroniella sulfidigena TaxID=723921 RepID=UPI00200A1AB8|nr:ABC transporter substrate-binding protein [Natroniella sulfidigena]MCK8817935.1 ABC transporter substrate-binding protein [Natroniella sulfidigena]
MFNSFNKSSLLWSLILIVGLLLAAGCGAPAEDELGVAFQPHYYPAASGILSNSQDIDHLNDELEVNYSSYLSGSDMISSMIAQDQTIGYMGDMPGLVAADNEQLEGVIVAKDVWSPGATTSIVTRKGEFDSVKDLDNSDTEIRVNHYSYSHRFMLHVMEDEGFEVLNPDDLLDGSPNTMLTQLENGDIDAAVVWEPFVSEILERSKEVSDFEAEVLSTGKDYPNFEDLSVVVAHPDTLDNNPETVVAWLKNHLKMQEIVNNEPEKAIELLSKPHTSYSNWIAERSLETFGEVDAYLSDRDREVLEDGTAFLQEHDIISDDFNLEEQIDMSYLEQALAELEE